MGVVSEDGLPPHFTRYSINSSSITFEHREWFEDPTLPKARRAEQAESLKKVKEADKALKEEKGRELYMDVVKLSTKLKAK